MFMIASPVNALGYLRLSVKGLFSRCRGTRAVSDPRG